MVVVVLLILITMFPKQLKGDNPELGSSGTELSITNTAGRIPCSDKITTKHLISAVANFGGFLKMTFWRNLILAFIIYHGSR